MPTIEQLSTFELVYFITFVTLIGLCIGSFTNVVILRGLSGESIVFPASKCPKCSHPLKWYDNIPLLSYLILGGKCRFCKTHISLQYPIIEALCTLLFMLTFLKFEFSITTIFVWAIVTLFVVLATTDLKEQVILTHHTYILAGIGVVYNFLHKEFLLPILGIIVGFGLMEIIARIGLALFGRRAFGEGDSYIGAAIGAILGWKLFISSLVIAIILQTFLILPLFLFTLIKTKQYKLFASIISFILAVIALLIFGNATPILYIILTTILIILGFIIIRQLFYSAKQANLQTIPFGPAMVLGAFLLIFLADYLKMFIF